MRLSDTSYVPTLRQALYALVAVSSAVLALLSTTLLAYQLRWTIGYNKPVVRARRSRPLTKGPELTLRDLSSNAQPALLVCSSLTLAHCAFFLCPVQSTATLKRRLLASLQVELVSLAVFTLFTLACLSRLHTSTPGLLSSCGGYFVCSALQGCYSLAWM